LPDQRRRVGDDRSHAEPRDEAQHEQLVRALGARGENRHDGIEKRAENQHRPAADPIGEHREEERAEQQADGGRSEDRTELAAGHAELSSDLRRDVAHRLHVEAVHDQRHRAEREQLDLKAADGLTIDQLADIDPRRFCHAPSPRAAATVDRAILAPTPPRTQIYLAVVYDCSNRKTWGTAAMRLPLRLHHHAWVTKDQEANRRFFEELLGMPLVATWCERTHNPEAGRELEYCHTFYALGDGGAL